MNSRERILAAFDHKPVDRVPTDIWAVPEVRAKLTEHFGGDYLAPLHIDSMASVGPEYIGPALPEVGPGETIDHWHVRRKTIGYGTGEYAEISVHPMAGAETLDDLESAHWLQADFYDCSTMAEKARKLREHQAVQCGYMAPFTHYLYLRGLENALTDPLLKPDFAKHLLARLCDFMYDHHRRMFESADGLIDVGQVTDDYGMQTGPMISLDVFREFYRPHLQRFIDLAHEFGIRVFHHDDGAIRDFIPDFVEMGMDILNPIQWRCPGMDPAELKRDFGERLCFHGGVDNQQTLPFGTPDDVRAEVRHLIDELASDQTGYVLAPCHNIQAVTPIDNILAMYDEAHHYGRF